jgi:hypothetical protein
MFRPQPTAFRKKSAQNYSRFEAKCSFGTAQKLRVFNSVIAGALAIAEGTVSMCCGFTPRVAGQVDEVRRNFGSWSPCAGEAASSRTEVNSRPAQHAEHELRSRGMAYACGSNLG